ncbi:cytochrome b561 domain-containing protein [Acidovorax sp. NPDC077693]|uniref:cytochrome b561 domain-containing protein n=1 Tax=unclassified Acidovorax TaxID=2684926 RepID=UPI0037C97481
MNELLQWLLTPISGSTHHEIARWAYWHARVMVLAWAIVLPLGILVARFFKVMPGQNWPAVRDNKAWWHAHRGLQYAGFALMLLGVALAWGNARGAHPVATLHGAMGWGVLGLVIVQIASAWARGTKGGPTSAQMRGDHFDMTPTRVTFEHVHKAGGYIALLASVATILLGLFAVDAPRWMWIVLVAWWLVLGAVFAVLQHRGRCMDTYQAIWGPDTGTPASQRPPVGWGVKRYTADQWQQKFGPPPPPRMPHQQR